MSVGVRVAAGGPAGFEPTPAWRLGATKEGFWRISKVILVESVSKHRLCIAGSGVFLGFFFLQALTFEFSERVTSLFVCFAPELLRSAHSAPGRGRANTE